MIVASLPSCMSVLNKSEPSSCASLLQYPVGLGKYSVCSSFGNSLRIRNAYQHLSNGSTISFYVSLASPHSCGPADYVNVSGVNEFSGRALESAVVPPLPSHIG